MITGPYELQFLGWELKPQETTHVDECEKAKLLGAGVNCGTV